MVALLAKRLRSAGLAVSVDRVESFVQSLQWLDPTHRDDLFHAARATLLTRREDLPVLQRVFSELWQAPGRVQGESVQKMPTAPRHDRRHRRPALVSFMAQKPRAVDPEVDVPDRSLAASPEEVLRRKDFSAMTEEELAHLQQLLGVRHFRFAERLTRRDVPHRRGRKVDLRRALASWAKRGALPASLPRTRRRIKPRPVVVLADISGSMELYSRVLLQFFHALGRGLPRFEVFVFATRLTRITEELSLRDPDFALDRVSHMVADFSGGTRIGEALQTFNRRWAPSCLGRGAAVIVVSDGCETRGTKVLEQEMRTLKNRCYRLIWLNPRLGGRGYAPRVRGMAAALPHVDDFLPCHNLQSLAAVADRLAQLPRGRRRAGRPAPVVAEVES